MKTIITMILMMTVSLSQGVVYMDLGLAPKGDVELTMDGVSISESEDLESGSLSIGYYQPVYQISDKMGLFVGGSYEVMPAKDEDVEFGFMVLYGSLGYSLSDQLSAWGSFGMSIPTSDDLKDADFVMGDSTWSGFNNLVIRLCTSRGFQPRIRETAHLREELLSLVMAGLGTLIYPECIENTSRFGLKIVPITDVKSIVTTSAVWLKRANNKNLTLMLNQIDDY